ncbi:RHOMBOID-like protein [Vigna angularis]|uniref:RHOMBOID-like protein n=1 Tax=Phaseolus angularis TaxID=3914 RepID=A0A8T0JRI6_PHAAN|nr:RHOMBOID-like protein [Vigna angularis]
MVHPVAVETVYPVQPQRQEVKHYRKWLQKVGALDVGRVVHRHQGWRLISCMWLHGGVFHLLANMLGILVIGIRLEQEFGFVLIGLLFVISGFGGSLLSALFIQSNISVGASGALFGLLGGMLSELITNWTIYENKLAALLTLVIIIVINLAVGILPHVDNFAHIGGFLTGFLLGFVFLIRPQFGWVNQRYAPLNYSPERAKPKFKKYQCILWVLSLVILIVGLSVGLVALLRGVDANDHCSWCHYLSCVPTSKWSCHTEPSYCVLRDEYPFSVVYCQKPFPESRNRCLHSIIQHIREFENLSVWYSSNLVFFLVDRVG